MARRVKPHRTVYRTAYAAPSATSYMGRHDPLAAAEALCVSSCFESHRKF